MDPPLHEHIFNTYVYLSTQKSRKLPIDFRESLTIKYKYLAEIYWMTKKLDDLLLPWPKESIYKQIIP